MRILHTSDWHLGRKLGEHVLLGEQEKFCDWLVGAVADEGVDVVTISGDLFDRSIPPGEAIELLNATFRRIRDAGAMVVAIAGNHDSATRLSIADGFTEAGGLILRGGYGDPGSVTPVTLGPQQLQLIAVPYLDPHMAPAWVVDELRNGGAVTHETVLAHALDRARAALDPTVPSLVLAHAFVTNASPSPSERELSVGDAAMVSAQLFDGFDYVALGHLHQPQVVGANAHIRYSGSPLPYSFSEVSAKSVVLADVSGPGAISVHELEVPVGRRVATVRGTLEDLCRGEGNPVDWVRAELTDDLRPLDSARLLRRNHPYLAQVEWVGGNSAPVGAPILSEVKTRTPADLIREFWTEAMGAEPSEEVQAVYTRALLDTAEPDESPEAAA